MHSWCELGYDYLFFRGGGVLLRRHELEKERFVVCRPGVLAGKRRRGEH